MQCVVLDGGLCNTAIFRHFGDRIRGVEGVYRVYIRAVCGLGWCIKQNRHFQTSWGRVRGV